MKATLSHLDPFRVPHPIAGDSPAGAPWGMFAIPHHDRWQRVQFDAHYIVCAADGEDLPDGTEGSGWDHISVHVRQTKGKNSSSPLPPGTIWSTFAPSSSTTTKPSCSFPCLAPTISTSTPTSSTSGNLSIAPFQFRTKSSSDHTPIQSPAPHPFSLLAF